MPSLNAADAVVDLPTLLPVSKQGGVYLYFTLLTLVSMNPLTSSPCFLWRRRSAQEEAE